MGISRTWPRAGAHVGSITEPTKVYKCMTKQSFYNQTSDKDMLKYLRRVQRLQCETAGSIVLWVHTGTTNDYHRVKNPIRIDVTVMSLDCDPMKTSSYSFYAFQSTLHNESTFVRLKQNVEYLMKP